MCKDITEIYQPLLLLYGISFAICLTAYHFFSGPTMTTSSSTTATSIISSKQKDLIEFNTITHLPIKLTSKNYPAWFKQINSLLIARDLVGYVDDTKTCPTATTGS